MTEAGDEGGAFAAKAAEGKPHFPPRLVEVAAAAIRQLTALQQVPDARVGIELRGIGGQAFEVEPRRRARREEVLDGLAAVDGGAVPDHEPLAPHLAQELAQNGADRRTARGGLLEVGEAAAVARERADGGAVVMRAWRTQDRRLTDRGRRARHQRQQGEAGFVYEEDRAVLGLGVA